MMDVAASGGYYVATAADEIVAHPTTITGSIGVIAMKFNVQGLFEKIGVEARAVKSGDKKDLLSPFRPATPEEITDRADDYRSDSMAVSSTSSSKGASPFPGKPS